MHASLEDLAKNDEMHAKITFRSCLDRAYFTPIHTYYEGLAGKLVFGRDWI